VVLCITPIFFFAITNCGVFLFCVFCLGSCILHNGLIFHELRHEKQFNWPRKQGGREKLLWLLFPNKNKRRASLSIFHKHVSSGKLRVFLYKFDLKEHNLGCIFFFLVIYLIIQGCETISCSISLPWLAWTNLSH